MTRGQVQTPPASVPNEHPVTLAQEEAAQRRTKAVATPEVTEGVMQRVSVHAAIRVSSPALLVFEHSLLAGKSTT